MPKLGTLAAAIGGVATSLALAACGGSNTSSTPIQPAPSVSQLEATPLGAALAHYGYTPVTSLYEGPKVVGAVWVVCPTGNLTTCTQNYAKLATMRRPVVWVFRDRITQLTGPKSTAILDGRSFYLNVPISWQNFPALKPTQRQALLGSIPAAERAVGSSVQANIQIRPIGETTAFWQHAALLGG